MTAMQAAALWTALNILLLIYLSARVGQVRMRNKINLGDAGNPDMLKAIRTQANYIEYAPAALLGLFLLASLGASVVTVHLLGAVFLVARVSHLLGLGMGVWPSGRAVGAVLTMLSLLATASVLLFYVVSG
jgi:uncharacterized membrane protein YecN with MAPEG domain